MGVATTPSADTVSPGIAGFLVIFALALATVLLIRSMVGHLRKVRYGPGPDGAEGDTPSDAAPAAPGAPDVAGAGEGAGVPGAQEAPRPEGAKGTKGAPPRSR